MSLFQRTHIQEWDGCVRFQGLAPSRTGWPLASISWESFESRWLSVPRVDALWSECYEKIRVIKLKPNDQTHFTNQLLLLLSCVSNFIFSLSFGERYYRETVTTLPQWSTSWSGPFRPGLSGFIPELTTIYVWESKCTDVAGKKVRRDSK